ncbi:hypothetical protein V6N13_083900 [Hibiscus sabdariffa]
MCAERDQINYWNREKEIFREQINESEIMGGDPMVEEASASLGKVKVAGHNDGVLKPIRQAIDTREGPKENVMDTKSSPKVVQGEEAFNDSKNDWANSWDKFFNSSKDLNSFAQ